MFGHHLHEVIVFLFLCAVEGERFHVVFGGSASAVMAECFSLTGFIETCFEIIEVRICCGLPDVIVSNSCEGFMSELEMIIDFLCWMIEGNFCDYFFGE